MSNSQVAVSWPDKDGKRLFGYLHHWDGDYAFVTVRPNTTGYSAMIHESNITFECG